MKLNLTVARRLALGFALVVILNILAGAINYDILLTTDRRLETITEVGLPGVKHANALLKNTLRYRVISNRHMLSTDPEEMEQLDKQCDALAVTMMTDLKSFTALSASPEMKSLAGRIEPALLNYRKSSKEVRRLSAAGMKTEAVAFQKSNAVVHYNEFETAVEKCVALIEATADAESDAANDALEKGRHLNLAAGLVVSVVAILSGWLVSRSINRELQAMAGTLDESSSQVAAAAGQLSSGSQSLAQGASEQAASQEEISASIEEISSMTKRNGDGAQNAKSLSAETRAAAETGHRDMSAMKTAMDDIKASSADIAKIIKTIDEIAFQTNILALNAAVEAARAGEHGAGFAVVAEEVRALAQRSATSARETAGKIEVAIQSGENGVLISAKVAESLSVIVAKARQVDELVAEISTASSEQVQGISQISTVVSQMDLVTQNNAANAEESAAAAEEMSAQSVMLQETVESLRRLVGGKGKFLPKDKVTVEKDTSPISARHGKPARVSNPLIRTRPAAKRATRTMTSSPADTSDFFRDA